MYSLTSSLRFSHRPHGLSSRISLSSSESSPLSLGDLCSDSLLLDLLPGMAMAAHSTAIEFWPFIVLAAFTECLECRVSRFLLLSCMNPSWLLPFVTESKAFSQTPNSVSTSKFVVDCFYFHPSIDNFFHILSTSSSRTTLYY